MPARVIDGRAIADALCANIKAEVALLGFPPGLAVVIVGEDPASEVYVRNKVRRAQEVGFESFKHALPAATSAAELLDLIHQLNMNESVDGILVQFPVPDHIPQVSVIEAIIPAKDVDGFHPDNTMLVPCTPQGCLHLIHAVTEDIAGLNAVVIGRSHHVGRPMADLLRDARCEVKVVHSQTKNPREVCATADILVAAVGKPKLVQKSWIKPGAIVIDVGINRLDDGSLAGDVDFEAVKEVAGAITPVPGGVGPMTVACLMENTLKAAKARRG